MRAVAGDGGRTGERGKRGCYFGNDYLGHPAAYWPAITLTVAQAPAAYEALKIWHYGGGSAGVHAPASLTVTDNYGHSTTFTGFPDSEPAITDIPITNMQGSILHLRFIGTGEFVGLNEVRVSAAP